MALLFLFVLAGALLSAPWKEWPCFKWRKVICLSKGRSSSSPSAFFFFFNVAYTILLCLFLLHIPIRPSFSPHINPCFHPSLWWNSSINQPASEGRLHSAPCCSKGNDGVQVWLLWQQYHCYTSSSQRSLEIRCHTKSAAFNSMIIWPAVGLWSIAATVRIHTHTHSHSLQRAPSAAAVSWSIVWMCAVQCVYGCCTDGYSHCETERLPSPPVPRLGSSGTSSRLLRHRGRGSVSVHGSTSTQTLVIPADF